MGFWGLNSDPQAWMASTLPTELFSQQPKNYFIDFVLKLLCSLISHSLPHFFLCPLSILPLSFPFFLYFLPSPFILLFFLTGSYYESQASLVLEITPQSSNSWGRVYLIGQLVFLSVCGPKCALHSFLNRGINTFKKICSFPVLNSTIKFKVLSEFQVFPNICLTCLACL